MTKSSFTVFRQPKTEPQLIYFAGKVSQGGGYRGKLLNNPLVMSLNHERYTLDGCEIIYGGPLAIACDHGCFHGRATHGCQSGGCCSGVIYGSKEGPLPLGGSLTSGIEHPVFNELPDDLIALCSKCHEKFHNIDKAV